MVFVSGVTQGNEDTRSVQYIILLFFWWKPGELGGRVSPRFPCVNPVVESFSSGLRQTIIGCWRVLHVESCQTSTTEFLREYSQRP